MACPYARLGLRPGASEAQVKASYRELARKWHPDTYRGNDHSAAELQFRKASDAYSDIVRSLEGGGGASSGNTSRDENGQSTWRRRYARPGASGASTTAGDAARYWQQRARASRPADFHEQSEFHAAHGARGARGPRLVVGPLLFAMGLGVCIFYAARVEPDGADGRQRPSSQSARSNGGSRSAEPSAAAGGMVDAVYNTKRRRWEQPHVSMYKDPLVASMIRQQPSASVYRPTR
jgi:hypothetical protein